MKSLAVLAICISVLTGCAAKEKVVVKKEAVTIQIPAAFKKRCVIPRPPNSMEIVSENSDQITVSGTLQSDVAAYILRLNKAFETCAARHRGLLKEIEEFNASFETSET